MPGDAGSVSGKELRWVCGGAGARSESAERDAAGEGADRESGPVPDAGVDGEGGVFEVNPKSEIRNRFKWGNGELEMGDGKWKRKNGAAGGFEFCILDLFRVSNSGFRIFA